MNKHALILLSGPINPCEELHRYTEGAKLIVAADAGIVTAGQVGCEPDYVVGDFDSLPAGVPIPAGAKRYPSEKDWTDGELALNIARENGFTRIVMIGALGGRLDHLLGNIWLIAPSVGNGLDVTLTDGLTTMWLTGEEVHVSGLPGEYVSIFPLGASVKMSESNGLKYQLAGLTLSWGNTLGVSNQLTEIEATVRPLGPVLVTHTKVK